MAYRGDLAASLMKIGPYTLSNCIFVAPMAGVTDRPFRQLCKALGAGYAVSEMVVSNPLLLETEKTSRRLNHDGEISPRAVQIAGADPLMMAQCARFNVERGAQIIDINMGCPVKKVCQAWCGAALLQDIGLVAKILSAVVKAVDVPVTLKFRTGWDHAHKNAQQVARLAQDSGIAMLTLHGRTRADGYRGEAEYETIAQVKTMVSIPVVANGDITTPEKAREVLVITGADALMIGRAAQGRPWIFREIHHFLKTGQHLPPPKVSEVQTLMDAHLQAHHAFYGDFLGVRSARKHIGWYVRNLPGEDIFRQQMHCIETCEAQRAFVWQFFEWQHTWGERLCLSSG